MKKYITCFASLLFAFTAACNFEKFVPPEQPDDITNIPAVSDTTYLQLRPDWDSDAGYDFNAPQDVLLGREPLVYIADTGNDRIVMLDLAGNILGQSQPVPHPVAMTQDSKLRLLIVSNDNKIYRINLLAHGHDIANAPVELVFEEVDNPDRRFTGISSQILPFQGTARLTYLVTATGQQTRDNQVLIFPEEFDVRVANAVNLEPNGLGILSASEPSGVTALRDFSQDFIFCMVGQNNFKVQWLTAGEFGFVARLSPAQGNLAIFQPDKFSLPEDVTVDQIGNIYVVDAEANYLYKFSPSGGELQSFGGSGSGERQFKNPQGVAFFDKTLYVADTGNNRIVRFKLSTDIEQ